MTGEGRVGPLSDSPWGREEEDQVARHLYVLQESVWGREERRTS